MRFGWGARTISTMTAVRTMFQITGLSSMLTKAAANDSDGIGSRNQDLKLLVRNLDITTSLFTYKWGGGFLN